MFTVLIVDDDPMVLNFCRLVLDGIEDIVLLRASTAHLAVECVKRHRGPIDLLLSDICMPGGMSGLELAETLCELRPSMRVLLMSGYSPNEAQLREGWALLVKPFPPSLLVAEVERLLGNRASRTA